MLLIVIGVPDKFEHLLAYEHEGYQITIAFFSRLTGFKVGNVRKISFCLDNWAGNGSLKEFFPDFFILAVNNDLLWLIANLMVFR